MESKNKIQRKFSRSGISFDDTDLGYRVTVVDESSETINIQMETSESDGETLEIQSFSKFDAVFSQHVSQEAVYHACASPLVHAALDGKGGTVITYGENSSGKSFVLEGSDADALEAESGFIPLALRDLFAELNKCGRIQETTVYISYVQIYIRKLMDLLAPMGDELEVRETRKDGVYVRGLSQHRVFCYEEALHLFQAGRRKYSEMQNDRTGRKQFVQRIFTIYIETAAFKSKLTFARHLDSNRLRYGSNYDFSFEEGRSFGSTAGALANVLSAIYLRNKYVPYRESKFTRLLTDSFDGRVSLCMIFNVISTASHRNETISSLKLAARVRGIGSHIESMQVGCGLK